MEKSIVVIEKDEPRVSTWDLAKGFEVEHRQIKTHIENFKSEFEELGFIALPTQQIKRKKGRQKEDFLLNEQQATYLATLLSNNDAARKFKLKLTKQFFAQRDFLHKLLLQRKNIEWIEKRENGKIERRIETDKIQEFVSYAKSQGSQNAERYYCIISKMENSALLSLEFLEQKFPNLRDVVDGFALDALKMADHVVARALEEGMTKQLPYKDVYLLAKQRVEMMAIAVGKTPIRLALKEQKNNS